jgi:Rrf2 family protein
MQKNRGGIMITTKGRYALRVMADIAENGSDKYLPLKEIAERQDISKKYLEIIVKELVAAGFLTGVSGKGGGYKLCRKPEEYTIGEILERMEGSHAAVACLMKCADPYPRAKNCHTLPLWKEYNQMTYDFFYSRHLSDLLP